MNSENLSFVDKIPKPLILTILILFSILSLNPLIQFGWIGIFKEGFTNSATIQIFVDLAISLFFFIAWLREDVKIHNRNFIFWVIITLTAGSFGPLFYLLTRKSKKLKK